MEGYVDHPACVCHHKILETRKFHYSDKLSMDGTKCERQEMQRFRSDE